MASKIEAALTASAGDSWEEEGWEREVIEEAELLASRANGSGRGDGYDADVYQLGPQGLRRAPGGVSRLVRYRHVSGGGTCYAWIDDD